MSSLNPPVDEQVGRTRLPNGIRVLTDRADFAQGVSIVAHVDVGSRDDPDESSGLAHVLEHMAFRATSKWDSVEMMALVEQTGGELNAYTTAESTAYEVYLPHEFLDLGVEILGELVGRPVLNEDDLRRERSVLIEEYLAAEDELAGIAGERIISSALGDHALGRAVRGRIDHLESMSESDLRSFHRDGYVASNLTIAASGRVDAEALNDAVMKHFDGVAMGAPASKAPPEIMPGVVSLVPRDADQVHLVYAWPGHCAAHVDQPAIDLALFVLGGGMSSRLICDLREDRGLVYNVGAWSTGWSDCGLIGVTTSCGPSRAEEVHGRVLAHIERLAAAAPAPVELDIALGAITGQLRLEADSLDGRVGRLLADETTFGRIVPIPEVVESYRRVDAQGVHEAIAGLLAATPHVVALGPIDNLTISVD